MLRSSHSIEWAESWFLGTKIRLIDDHRLNESFHPVVQVLIISSGQISNAIYWCGLFFRITDFVLNSVIGLEAPSADDTHQEKVRSQLISLPAAWRWRHSRDETLKKFFIIHGLATRINKGLASTWWDAWIKRRDWIQWRLRLAD